jgi:ABC-2 type transport system permease protein
VISLRRLGVIVAHELRLVRRDPLPILVLVVFPLILMAFLKPAFRPALVQAGHRGANGAEQSVPGEAVVNGFFIVSLTTFAFFAEWGWSTWDRLRASPATSLEVVLGKGLPRVVMSVAQFVVVFAIGIPAFGLHVRGPLAALVPLVLALAICLVLLGVALTALCRTVQQANTFSTVGLVVFGAIGGALVPFSVLPGWARTVAPITPTYWAMRGFRSVILDGQSLGGVQLPIAVLLSMGVLFGVVALARFRFDDSKTGFNY